MSRRLILILILLIVLSGAGLFLYANRKMPVATPLEITPSEIPPESAVQPLPLDEPIIEDELGALRLVAPIAITDYWLDPADRTAYLAGEDGIVYAVLPGGGVPTESMRIPMAADSQIAGFTGSGVSPAALVEYRSALGIKTFAVINPALNKTQFLPSGVIAAAWSPSGLEIAFVQDRAGSSVGLHILTVSSNKSRRITSLPILDPVLSWVSSDEILISTRASDSTIGAAWRYSIKNKTLTRVGEPTTGLSISWRAGAPFGLRYSASPKALLEIISASGKSLGQWEAPTIPEKCVTSPNEIICATPTEKTLLPRIRDNYLQRGLYTTDSLISVRVANSALADGPEILYPLAGEGTQIDAYHLEKNGSILYFMNRYDKKLYSLRLP